MRTKQVSRTRVEGTVIDVKEVKYYDRFVGGKAIKNRILIRMADGSVCELWVPEAVKTQYRNAGTSLPISSWLVGKQMSMIATLIRAAGHAQQAKWPVSVVLA
jgi:hypothetical protein